jgi:predicted 2-oxoglutarate/Fe(II)-dependent dioxygenase YbiX
MIHEFFDIVSDINLCDRSIEYYNKNDNPSKNSTSSFDGRTIYIEDIKDTFLKNELKCILYKITQKLYKINSEYIFPEFADIVKWDSNQDMAVHVDDCTEDLIQRHYTAVCYLNDDYSGGETFLPEHNYMCKPKKGKVIVFPSYYLHGVNMIENGPRYTFAMWFTRFEHFSI